MKRWPLIILISAQVGVAQPVSKPDFIHDIQPAMVNAGCSSITCHGGIVGRGGLKFSMFGADVKKDFDAIARDNGARRINVIEPKKSMLLRIITGELKHGAPSISPSSTLVKNTKNWIKQGAIYNNKPGLTLKNIQISMPTQTLKIGESQPMKVEALFSNGRKMDVTKYCYFESQNEEVLACGDDKEVVARAYGEAVVFARYMHDFGTIRVKVPQKINFPFPKSSNNKIDQLVDEKLKELGIPPAYLCSDEVFVRRVHLDLTGRIPSVKIVRAFLTSQDSNKRSKLIDTLLKSDRFADYQALKWGDLLRCKSEFPSNLWPNAVQAYYRWMRTSVNENKPFDQFANELLTASGSNFRKPTVNFYRAFQKREPRKIAETATLLFMGTRFECARCHAHPKTAWKQLDTVGLGTFFSQLQYKKTAEWKEEIVYIDRDKKVNTDLLWLPDGKKMKVHKGDDLRVKFADWLTAKENPWFSKSIVNRIWFWLNGRGIVHDPDDFRDTNPPINPELLAYLENELKDSDFDLKHIFRIILNSETYQRSSITTKWNHDDHALFSHYPIRRMEAEALIDTVCDITGMPEKYMSRVPEPFTFLPAGHRAVQLSDGTITSNFLEMFGRPGRDSSYESNRDNDLTTKQVLHFLNSSHILDKISKSSKIKKLDAEITDSKKLVEELYLSILSRFPSEIEKQQIAIYFAIKDIKRRDGINDLIWALINTKEFMFNH